MSETKTCPRCGAPIRPDETPAGLCAACLMKMGLDSRSGAAEVVLTESERVERPPAPTIAELAPHFPELEIVELVGRGGMGAVYRAKQRSLDRDVALKVLTVGTGDATFADRFQREARTLATLSHPAITAVFDFGQRGPWSFLAMEFVEGASLRQMLRARELGARESLAIVSQMCDALQYAHDKGVVHRDIKPENVLVTRDGRVKLLDFGLAKLVGTAQRDNLTQARQVMGTPHYMAPEQWEKPLTVDHRADIYAMGVVFYELLTGELPIGRFAPPSHKVAVDVRLDDVVLRSLEKEPDRRYQHASEVKDEVAGITSTPGGVPPAVEAVPKSKRSAGHKWLVVGAGIGCLALLAVPVSMLAFFVFAAPRAVQPTQGTEDSSAVRAPVGPARVGSTGLNDAERALRTSLAIDDEMAKSLGIPPERLPELKESLDRIWCEYLDQEDKSVRGIWISPAVVQLSWEGPVKAEEFFERASGTMASRTSLVSTAPHPAYVKLQAYLHEQIPFADGCGSIELSIHDGGAYYFKRSAAGGGVKPTIIEENVERPPSVAMQRLWTRAVAQLAAAQPGDKAAQYVDANAYLDSKPDSLTLPDEVAAKLGIPADRVADLNRDLEKAWNGYLSWEAKGVRLRWLSPEVLEANGATGGLRPDKFVTQAKNAIERATVRSNMTDSTFQTLQRFVKQQMFFADAWVHYEVSIRDSTAEVKRIQYRGATAPALVETTIESPPSAVMQRLWDRAVAERDAQPR